MALLSRGYPEILRAGHHKVFGTHSSWRVCAGGCWSSTARHQSNRSPGLLVSVRKQKHEDPAQSPLLTKLSDDSEETFWRRTTTTASLRSHVGLLYSRFRAREPRVEQKLRSANGKCAQGLDHEDSGCHAR